MTLSIIARDITDERGNLLEGAVVTIRQGHGAGGALADLFEDAAGATPLANPITVESGTLSVYVQPGRYRLEGTSSAGSGVSLVDAKPIVGKPYEDRAEFVADVAAGYLPALGLVATAGGLEYEYIGGSNDVLGGLPGWVPFGNFDARHFGVVVLDHGEPEPSIAEAVANADAWQATIDASSALGRAILLPDGVIWVARWHQRKTNSAVIGVDREGGSVIKMHGAVHRNMPLSVSSLRGDPQGNIQWSNVTFDFNRARWSRGRNTSNTGVTENTSQVDTYGAENIIPFSAEDREEVFGEATGALTQSAFIASDVNAFSSGKRSVYSRIRAIDGYKHSLDVTAPSYRRGRGRLIGPRFYDEQPACGIDLYDCYAVGAGDDCVTTHQCDDINFYNIFADVPSGVRTGNTNCVEVDDGSRNVRFYGRTVAFGGTTGMEIKGHSDSPAPHDVYVERLVAVNCNLSFEARHLGHHSGTANVTYTIIGVSQAENTFTVSTNVLEEPLGDTLGEGDEFEVTGSSGNNGVYVVDEVSVDEVTGVTTITIVTDPDDENLPEGALTSIPSSAADGTIPVPEALTSPTAERVSVDRLTVIAPRRLNWMDDERVVWRRNSTRRGMAVKAYRGVEIGTAEFYDGRDLAPDLENFVPRFLPTDMLTGGTLVRPFLRSERLTIRKLIIRGFPQITYGVYTTGSFRGGLTVGHIDSIDGPRTVMRATGGTSDVTVGSYSIRRDVAEHGVGTWALRLSGERTNKNIGPGTVEGYGDTPITWGGKSADWSDEEYRPVGWSQPIASERRFITTGTNSFFGNHYSQLSVPQAGAGGYILLADLANGAHNIVGEIHSKRNNGFNTGNHSMVMRLMTSSGDVPERRALLWDVQAHSSTSVPSLVTITEGGKDWLAIKAPSESQRPLSGNSGWFTGRAVLHDDLFRVVPAGAEGGDVAASEAPALNRGSGGDPVTPTWQFGGSELYRRGNILGTVSQSGGVPTGAVIEHDSNANGYFTRYADGVQECWGEVELTFAGVGGSGGGFELSGAVEVVFPAAFVGADSGGEPVDENPNISMLLRRNTANTTTSIFAPFGGNVSNTGFTARAWNLNASAGSQSRIFQWKATGRWF